MLIRPTLHGPSISIQSGFLLTLKRDPSCTWVVGPRRSGFQVVQPVSETRVRVLKGQKSDRDAATKLIYLAILSFKKTGRILETWVATTNELAILLPGAVQ